ncbi:PREDICTED: probable inactive serine/threonine-protein kinase fnkC isoform X2 [Tarenaya hassleriana]|uniref:probable inactive serine/threonine-protein kinase fnkC isoform X2 n=1 Tax=Tarenaya hassleriana TaxID=28532 RepID=UPI0008FD8F0E|nr:PREDICTED: probable inactive serine/threonine-protein kinase fnkC isoform X2 [Tarenaya hassleriana]
MCNPRELRRLSVHVCICVCIRSIVHIKSGNEERERVSISRLERERMGEERHWRRRPPAAFILTIENYVKLSEKVDKFESHPFSACGYTWTLIMYPKGNKEDGGGGHTSLYVKIDEACLRDAAGGEVYAEVKFYQYRYTWGQYVILKNNNEVARFRREKPEYGFGRVSEYPGYIQAGEGFVGEEGSILVGVDIFVAPIYKQSQVLSLKDTIDDSFFSWTLRSFSALSQHVYQSVHFSAGGRCWALKLYPNGNGAGEGNSLSLYVVCRDAEPNEKIYLRAKLQVADRRRSKHAEKLVDDWSNTREVGWGYQQFVPLAEIRDPSKGFLLNDALKIHVEFIQLTKSTYFK